MITLEDCKAFCDASLSHVEDLARQERLGMVQACALAYQQARLKACEVSAPRKAAGKSPGLNIFPPSSDRSHPLRSYPPNSPPAMARLIILAALADGDLDDRELALLNHRGALSMLQISREDFVQVFYDFCADVANLADGSGECQLSPAMLAGLFAEVTAPKAKERVLDLIVSIISSDGRFTEGEEKLFINALDAWHANPGGAAVRGARRRYPATRRAGSSQRC